jgi:catechol 2,3-dioxygenase-like lactoylglutathione lyase family enzyme
MVYPCIKVCDIETTIHWYVDFLGFTCTFKSSIKHPEYAIIECGVQKIFIETDPKGEFYAKNSVVVETDDIESTYSALSEKGVIFRDSISKGVFGSDEFNIKDYEDNRITYRQST